MFKIQSIPHFQELQWLFALCILLHRVSETLTGDTKPLHRKSMDSVTLSTFVSNLISTRFSHCTVLIAESKTVVKPKIDDGDFREVIEKILEQTSQDSFLVDIPQTAGCNSSSAVDPTERYNSILDLHQHRDKCTVGIFVLHNSWPNFSDKLYETTSKWSKILKKDEDFFIFLAKDEIISEGVLGNGSLLAIKVKFKAVILESESASGGILMKSTCIYCDHGNPTIVPIPWGQLQESNPSEVIHFKETKYLFPDFVKNMYGKVLKVTSPMSTRWLHELVQVDGTWTSKRGVYKFVVQHLMLKHNFSCSFFPASGTGVQYKNGTWAGGIGDIVNNVADIGYPAAQTWHRDKVAGFAVATTYEKIGFTSGEPLPFFSWKAVFWPLSYEVWAGMGLSYILVNVSLYLINRAARDGVPENNFGRIIEYTWSALLEQDLPITGSFVGHPIRFFIAFWIIFALVVATAYRSQLVSFLAFPNVEVLPATFEELSNSDFTIALQYLGGAAFQLFRTSTNPTYQKLFARMEMEPIDSKCFARAIGNRFACISWVTTADFVYRRNLSDQHGRVPLVRAPDSVSFISCSIFMEKRAIFRTNFNSLIISAADGGLTEKWRQMDMDYVYEQRRAWEKATNKSKVHYAEQESWGALTNLHFKGAYYLLFFGAAIALMAFIKEKIYCCKRKEVTFVDEVESSKEIMF